MYLDDLSFEANDDSYKALKACLEGRLQPQPDNVISTRPPIVAIYAGVDAGQPRQPMVDGQLHPSDSIEEKISLSDRFGLWLSFHPCTQDQYLAVVEQTLLRKTWK